MGDYARQFGVNGNRYDPYDQGLTFSNIREENDYFKSVIISQLWHPLAERPNPDKLKKKKIEHIKRKGIFLGQQLKKNKQTSLQETRGNIDLVSCNTTCCCIFCATIDRWNFTKKKLPSERGTVVIRVNEKSWEKSNREERGLPRGWVRAIDTNPPSFADQSPSELCRVRFVFTHPIPVHLRAQGGGGYDY